MKENQVANTGQTIYARSMPAVATQEVSRGPQQEFARAAHAASEIAEQQISKDPEQEKTAREEARNAAKKAAKQVADEQEITIDPRAEAREAEAVRKEKQEGRLKIFDVLPADAGSLRIIGKFLGEIGEKTLDKIDEHLLIFIYLQLRLSAEKAGDKTAVHLKPLEEALKKKGIFNLNALYAAFSKVFYIQMFWRGEAKAGTIRPDAAQKKIAAEVLPKSGGALEDLPEDSGVPPLDTIVLNLKRIPLNRRGQTDPEYYEDQRRRIEDYLVGHPEHFDQAKRILEEIDTLIGESRHYRGELQQRQRESERGFYGDQKLIEFDKRTIREEIRRITREIESGGRSMHDRVTSTEMDRIYNKMFNRLEARFRKEFHRDAFGQAGDLEFREYMDYLQSLRITVGPEHESDPARQWIATDATREVIKKFMEKYDQEFELREIAHNAFHIADSGGEFKDFAGYLSRFSSEYADTAFLDAPEVEAAMRVREQVLYQIRREHGFIPPELVAYDPKTGRNEWEDRTREIMDNMTRNNMFDFAYNGNNVWKIDRAMNLSRGLGMVFLRFPEIVAETPLFGPQSSHQSQASIPWEKLVWDLNPLDHKIKRYGIGESIKAVIYAAKNRGKNRSWHDWWNKKELEDAIALDAVSALGTMHGQPRMVDMRNFWHTGGPFTHTGWRPYDSALKANRDELRELLKRNPGLAMGTIFNKYENKELGAMKWEFINDPTRADLPKAELLRLWQEESARASGAGEELWDTEERALWVGAAHRVPHVVARILTDEANGLLTRQQAETLLLEAFSNEVSEKARSEIESDVGLAKEHMMKRRREAIAEGRRKKPPLTDEQIAETLWTPDKDMLLPEDFNEAIKGEHEDERRVRAQHFLDVITSKVSGSDTKYLDKLVNMTKDGNYPFALTTEDVPWSEFYFGQTGGRGYFTRKINDALADAEADDVLVDMLKSIRVMKGPEDIVAKLYEIFRKSEVHSAEYARQGIENLSIGIIRLFQKDGITKVPILGELKSLFNKITHQGDSFAEKIYGSRAPAWDNDDIYNFTEQLRGILKFDQIQRIRKETGGTFLKSLIPRSKVGLLYILPAFLLYSFMEKLIKEK